MDDEAAGHHRPLRVQLDLHLDRQPICGRLRTDCGAGERCVGWLGFVDALKRVHDMRRRRKATPDQEDTEMTDRATKMKPTLVLGGTGKTGRRVVERLRARGLPVRVGSRSGTPPFDWEDRSTWAPALDGVGSVYLSYYPDLAVPGAVEATRSFAELAMGSGVQRLVLLSGRGEPEAERAERAVRDTGAELTILRSTWFMQSFSEDYMLEHALSGEIRLPGGDVSTPFLDVDDLADVAVAALTENRHVGELTS
jgi:nucleoside-diphosphate-sugar epimerase